MIASLERSLTTFVNLSKRCFVGCEMEKNKFMATCVNPQGYMLTEGKYYEIIRQIKYSGDLFYAFVDDTGNVAEAFAHRFIANPLCVELL